MKCRILKESNLYYIQNRRFFFWCYITDIFDNKKTFNTVDEAELYIENKFAKPKVIKEIII
jgi:predicted metal-dependent peptidase